MKVRRGFFYLHRGSEVDASICFMLPRWSTMLVRLRWCLSTSAKLLLSFCSLFLSSSARDERVRNMNADEESAEKFSNA